MSRTKPGTVAETGAKPGGVLEGAEPANSGVVIRVQDEQKAGHTGWVQGPFTLLAAGGLYRGYLTSYINGTFTARELIAQIAPRVGKRNLQILNCNMLKLSRQKLGPPQISAEQIQNEVSNKAAHQMDLPETPKVELVPQEMMPVSVSLDKPDALTDIERHQSEFRGLESTEQLSIIKSRIGQGVFTEGLVKLWGGCSVTGLLNSVILRASHARPWRDSTNKERLDPFNGLLLIPNLDVLFDNGLITFDQDGRLIISKRLSQEECLLLGLSNNLRLRKRFPENQKYLSYHQEKVFEK